MYSGIEGEGDSPDPGKEDVEQNSSPAHTTQETQSKQNSWECNNPVDVLCIVDLIGGGTTNVTLRGNNRVRDARSHGEVSDCADEESNGEDVVKDSLIVARLEAECKVDELEVM
jgi:hypothetical protein